MNHRANKPDAPHRAKACQMCGKILGWCKCFNIEYAEVEFDGTCDKCVDEKLMHSEPGGV